MRIKGAALQRNGAGKKRSCVTQRGVQRRDGGLQWSEGQAEGRAGEGGGHNARGPRTSPPPSAPQHRDAPRRAPSPVLPRGQGGTRAV